MKLILTIDGILALHPTDRASLFRAARGWLDLAGHELPRSGRTLANIAAGEHVSEDTIRAIWAVFFERGLKFHIEHGTMWVGAPRKELAR